MLNGCDEYLQNSSGLIKIEWKKEKLPEVKFNQFGISISNQLTRPYL